MLAWLQTLLKHPRFAWVLAGVAFFVHAPTLRTGYLIDDYAQRYFAQGYRAPGGPHGFWDLYRFSDGGAGTREAIDIGIHPWWADPQIKLAFFRPITSTLRFVEEAVFGDKALGPHFVSCLLFVCLALLVLRLMRLWIGGAAASLAALLFAIDDAHATTVVWIAARHTLVGAIFVVLGLISFIHARSEKRLPIMSGVLLFCGLSSSESALGGLGFFFAIAAFPGATLGDATPRALSVRLRDLAPVFVATIVWVVVYVSLGYGARGSAFYVDPATDPIRFLEVALYRAPILALSQVFFPPADVVMAGAFPLVAFGTFAALFIAVVSYFSIRVLGRARALPLIVAMLLSIIPACGTSPDDRLLMLPGVAAFGLLGLWARHARNHPGLRWKILGGVGAFVHVGLALLLLPVRALVFATMFTGLNDRGEASLPSDEALAQQHLIVLSAPDGLLPSSMSLKRILSGRVVPLSSRVLLGSPASTLKVTRTTEDTLDIFCEKGTMHDVFVGAYRATPFTVGERVVTKEVIVEVTAVVDNHPTRLRMTFPAGISTTRQRWIAWKGHRFEDITPPALGETLELPAIDFNEILAGPK